MFNGKVNDILSPEWFTSPNVLLILVGTIEKTIKLIQCFITAHQDNSCQFHGKNWTSTTVSIVLNRTKITDAWSNHEFKI